MELKKHRQSQKFILTIFSPLIIIACIINAQFLINMTDAGIACSVYSLHILVLEQRQNFLPQSNISLRGDNSRMQF